MGHQSYVLLCTETTLANHPVVHPKSSCDIHLLRSLCLESLNRPQDFHAYSDARSTQSEPQTRNKDIYLFANPLLALIKHNALLMIIVKKRFFA